MILGGNEQYCPHRLEA